MVKRFLPFLALLFSLCAQAMPLEEAINGTHRSPGDQARDRYRHPQKTLRFFDVQQDMTVVEVWPGGQGWYTAILAPWLHDNGTFYAAHFAPDSNNDYFRSALNRFKTTLAHQPAIYDQVRLTHLQPPDYRMIAPAESADRVLTFRNVHNWEKAGQSPAMFASFFQALKPGGILGIVEHRAPATRSRQEQIASGYMSEARVIQLAEQAGFKLQDKSEINANPKDTAEHPDGVWTLPPTLRQGETNRQHYIDIGESDRMTLKFIKPD